MNQHIVSKKRAEKPKIMKQAGKWDMLQIYFSFQWRSIMDTSGTVAVSI